MSRSNVPESKSGHTAIFLPPAQHHFQRTACRTAEFPIPPGQLNPDQAAAMICFALAHLPLLMLAPKVLSAKPSLRQNSFGLNPLDSNSLTNGCTSPLLRPSYCNFSVFFRHPNSKAETPRHYQVGMLTRLQ